MKPKKLAIKDQNKIMNRYYSKIEEFKSKSYEEIRALLETKMSRTDRAALIECYSKVLPITSHKDGTDTE